MLEAYMSLACICSVLDLDIRSATKCSAAHSDLCVLQATSAAIRQFVSDILLKILQKHANPRLQALVLVWIINNRAKVPSFVAKGCIQQIERLYDKRGIPLPTGFPDILVGPRAGAVKIITDLVASVEDLQEDASTAQYLLELLLSALTDERPSFIAFLDLFSRCAEENASVYLLEKLANEEFRSKWQHLDCLTVEWYSTHAVSDSLTQFDLCGVCASAFVPRLEFLLERSFS